MPRPRTHDDAVRTRLLETAAELTATRGADGLTVRAVAAGAGTSTTAVYTLFGSRDALVHAVGAEAFARFSQRLAQVPRSSDARADLLALGVAYRASALAEPHFYRVMFATAGAGAGDPQLPPATESPTFGVLESAVARVLGRRRRDRAHEGAIALWGLVHGLVGLELAGLLPGDETVRADRYVAAMKSAGPALLGGPAAGRTR